MTTSAVTLPERRASWASESLGKVWMSAAFRPAARHSAWWPLSSLYWLVAAWTPTFLPQRSSSVLIFAGLPSATRMPEPERE